MTEKPEIGGIFRVVEPPRGPFRIVDVTPHSVWFVPATGAVNIFRVDTQRFVAACTRGEITQETEPNQ